MAVRDCNRLYEHDAAEPTTPLTLLQEKKVYQNIKSPSGFHPGTLEYEDSKHYAETFHCPTLLDNPANIWCAAAGKWWK